MLARLPTMSDQLACEAAIVCQIERVMDVNRRRIQILPSRARCDAFYVENTRFADFAERIGVRVLPASGHIVAFYIIDLLDRGVSLDEIETAVEAIRYMHVMTHQYLDWLPIQAALEFASKHAE
jgi:hypothetical protein